MRRTNVDAAHHLRIPHAAFDAFFSGAPMTDSHISNQMVTSPPQTTLHETRRAHRSCDQCRARKTKCDSMRPCSSCRRGNHVCTQLPQRRRKETVGRNVAAIRRYEEHLAAQKNGSIARFLDDGLQASSFSPSPSVNKSAGPLPQTPNVLFPDPEPVGQLYELSDFPIDDFIRWEDDLDSQVEPFHELTSVQVYPENLWNDLESLPALLPRNHYNRPDYNSMRGPSTLHANCLPLPPELNISTRSFWPESISEQQMLPWIEVFFERLHPTLPILSRPSLYSSMMSHEHRRNPEFGSMLLSLCAFALTQPVLENEQLSYRERESQASMFLDEATKLHDTPSLGESPSVNTVLTSFFMFGCQFGRGQHGSAWLRLREAVNLAIVLGLHNPSLYSKFPPDVRDQRLGIFLILSITERGYAIQQRHSIELKGKPGKTMRSIYDVAVSSVAEATLNIITQPKSGHVALTGLFQLIDLFDTIGIDESLIKCWNGQCKSAIGRCENMDAATALIIHQDLKKATGSIQEHEALCSSLLLSGDYQNDPLLELSDTQKIDVCVLQLWLMSRLWNICLTHNLLEEHSEYPQLELNYALKIARSTVNLCKRFCISAMEAHGIGFIERLYDIGSNALTVVHILNHRSPSTESSWPLHAIECSSSSSSSASASFWSMDQPVSMDAADSDAIGGILRLLSRLRGGQHPHLQKFLDQKKLVLF
ncbi:hypothetical protein B0J14DRAFT_376056 [Halenospora varia]|nr:hypothetical protein B0J14DRAFT_376056 [Halenospora varia]